MNRPFETQGEPRQMPPAALLALGGPNLAHIGPIVVDGAAGYAIHAADGTVLGVAVDRDTAFAGARQNDLEPVSVH